MPDAGWSITNSAQVYQTSSILDALGRFRFLDDYTPTAVPNPDVRMTYPDVIELTTIGQIIIVPYDLTVEVTMSTKIWVVCIVLAGLLGGVWVSSSYAEGTVLPPEVANNIGSVLLKAYTYEPVHPNPQTICPLTKKWSVHFPDVR
jgi:hypothetical protein